MTAVPFFRMAVARALVALVLALAMPVQWEAFCGGWQSPHEAMACCHRASRDDGPSAAFGCCAAQEQSRHAQSQPPVVVAHQLVLAQMPVPAAARVRARLGSTRTARSADSRLLASVFLI
jgi:hypothetical protein